jgi:mycothiol system anti-sigma-R factor
MNCEESFEMLFQYIDKDMDSLTIQEIEVHLKHCRPCWDRFEFEKKLKERFRKSCCKEPCPDSLLHRIKALLEKY